MSDLTYKEKLETLQRYIPFLNNMMTELQAKGNRQAQLAKIKSLHDMITDKEKKLKIETLNKCEEVLANIYYKVNPQMKCLKDKSRGESKCLPGIEGPVMTPRSPSPPVDVIPLKPVHIPTEKVSTHSKTSRSSHNTHRPKIEVYSNVVISPSKRPAASGSLPDMSKPPISLDDLRNLEEDIQQKIKVANLCHKSVDELQEVKKILQLQLRVDQFSSRMSSKDSSEASASQKERIAKQPETNESPIREIKSPTSLHMKNEKKSSAKASKDGDIFGDLLSSMDNKLLEENRKSKKHERRSSSDKAENKRIDSDASRHSSKHPFKEKEKHKDKRDTSKDKNGKKYDYTDKPLLETKSLSEETIQNEDKLAKELNKTECKDAKNDESVTMQIDLPNLFKNETSINKIINNENLTEKPASSEASRETKDSSELFKDSPPAFKRLADKYNPKPKQKIANANIVDIDKAVSDSIENDMKTSPVKAMLVSENVTPTFDLKKPIQLPEILQKMFNKPSLSDRIPTHIETTSTHPNLQNKIPATSMMSPGIIQPNVASVLSSSLNSLHVQSPKFLSPPHATDPMLSVDVVGRPSHMPGNTMLPTPPIPPSLPSEFIDQGQNLGYGTPRVDFDTPSTPMMHFHSPSVDFEPHNQFPLHQRFISPVPDHQRHAFNPMNQLPRNQNPLNQNPMNTNFLGQNCNFNSYDLTQGPMAYYAPNQMPDMPQYMPEPGFYQDRYRWQRNRRPGDPRNYKEYREMKERQEREARAALEKQKEIKDPRLAARDNRMDNIRDPRLSREANFENNKDRTEPTFRDPRLSRREKNCDSFRESDEFAGNTKHENWHSKERVRNRDRTSADSRNRSLESRPETSRFDKMYSATTTPRPKPHGQDDRDEEDESFISPLGSLYNAAEKRKTGRGYGVQHFKIPKRTKGEDEKRKIESAKEEKLREKSQANSVNRRKRIIEIRDSDDSDANDTTEPMALDSDDEKEDEASKSQPDLPKKEEDENLTKKLTTQKDSEGIDTSRIKVIIKDVPETTSDNWKIPSESPAGDSFISEYDLEFQNNKNDTDLPDLKGKSSEDDHPKLKECDINESPSSQEINQLSTSNEVAKNHPNDDFFRKPAEPNEAECLRNNITEESTSRNEGHSEQSILVNFFQNLLKSSNKKDKKSALFSLIETFSDSFENKQIEKIRKIINSEQEEEEASDEDLHGVTDDQSSNAKKTELTDISQEEQPVVGSTTEEPSVINKEEHSISNNNSNSETQVNEITKSTDDAEELQSDDSAANLVHDSNKTLEPVMVSVSERIKSRRRNIFKPKKKNKSELDLLHEDIQDMFIRDGVLTATGQRMCRMLKNDPTVLTTGDQVTLQAETSDLPKKNRKKPGPKPKLKVSNHEISHNTLKDVRIVIRKMSDADLGNNITKSSKRKTKSVNYVEVEDEIEENTLDTASIRSLDASSIHSDVGELSDEFENDKHSQLEADTPKPRSRRRKAPKWASGIIPKSKKRKQSVSKSKENSPDRVTTPQPTENTCLDEFYGDHLVEPDKNYFYDYVKREKISCKLCKFSGHLLVTHYLKEHPQSEVLISRFPPHIASEAIEDFSVNVKALELLSPSKISCKYEYCCRMCGYKSCVSPLIFYEHVTTHTGEYRHQCGICEYVAVTSKSIRSHFTNSHPDQEKKIIKTSHSMAVIFGYMCGECNFVQLKENNVRDHVDIFHLGGKPTIYKVNMSTIIDPQLIQDKNNLDLNASLEPAGGLSIEEVDSNVDSAENAHEMSKKIESDLETSTDRNELQSESDKTTNIVTGKRPGPKSKTMPVVEKEVPQPSEEAIASPAPVRKKPGPKSKTRKKPNPAILKDNLVDDAMNQNNDVLQSTSALGDKAAKVVATRKRKRSLEKLISEDSGDDLDSIITLSSRSSRAAKEKATAKLKSLMETNEGLSGRVKDKSAAVKDSAETHRNKNRTDGQQESSEEKVTEQIRDMDLPITGDKPPEKSETDLNVFTCKNDILQEETKKIEEDRLRQMDELNKSIGSRTPKLDFTHKLSNRLNNEQQCNNDKDIQVKEEPRDDNINGESVEPENKAMPRIERQVVESISKTPSITNIGKSAVVVKKPPFEPEADVVQQPSINFRQNKPNSLFSNMIEKLQGKVNEAVVQGSKIDSATEDTSVGSETKPEIALSIGDLIKATKFGTEIIYSCHADNCCFSTKDKMAFHLHCKLVHEDLTIKSSLCDKCGIIVEVTPDTTLLENLYDHLLFAHSDFLSQSTVLRMRRMSGDKLSIKKEAGAEEEHAGEHLDFENKIDHHVVSTNRSDPDTDGKTPVCEAPLEIAENNPFSFKIASVMSLAESNENPKYSPVKQAVVDDGSSMSSFPQLKLVPPLTLITPKPTATQSLIVKEAKLAPAELVRPKKTQKALQKFMECPEDLYKCPHFYCMFSTNVRTLLTCHLKAHKCDSALMVPCVYCDMKTPWEHVPVHIDIRHASSKFSCSDCLYRAILKEYVALHYEMCHPGKDIKILYIPPHKAAKKFSVADTKTDFRTLCEPFRCLCSDVDGGEKRMHEYLFETEFANHLNTAHAQKVVACAYQNCDVKVLSSSMINHWAEIHGVCTFQCCFCKISTTDVAKMIEHFSLVHMNSVPDILVRKTDFLPPDQELGYSDLAFSRLNHIKKAHNIFLQDLRKRINMTTVIAGATDKSTGTSIIPKAPALQNTPIVKDLTAQLPVSTPNLQLIVTTTGGPNEKLYLLPASIVPTVGQAVMSTAPMNKAAVSTSTAPINFLQLTESVPKEPVKIGNITLYPLDENESVEPMDTQTNSPVNVTMSPQALPTAKADNLQTISNKNSAASMSKDNLLCDELIDDNSTQDNGNNTSVMSEDDLLQTAIQSILNNEVSNTSRSVSSIPVDPPPLVFLHSPNNCFTPEQSNVQTRKRDTPDVIAPVEHITLEENETENNAPIEEEDPLNLGSTEEPNVEIPYFSDVDRLDPLMDYPLAVESNQNDHLPSGDPVATSDTNSLVLNKSQLGKSSHELNKTGCLSTPIKITSMDRSMSVVSNSDDESDTNNSEKKKTGLLGYQLFRCAKCNISFSNVKSFRYHINSSLTCKKPSSKGFQCAHCDKALKTTHRLADHIMTHGVPRFSCSLCNEKFALGGHAKHHIKARHSINQYVIVPLVAEEVDLDINEFVIKPTSTVSTEKESMSESPGAAGDDHSYTPDQIDNIPIRQIFSTNVKCGLCNYQTKVRVNIIRHLQMHLDEKAVPDSAPVNPVPCLEKNEKMFDKMMNLAASSITKTPSRMGGPTPEKEKDDNNYPEFIPSHRRFVCCAQGCSYLCPEEGNLKHHIMALHSDESNFTCAHCKANIEATEIESVIKHFKLHGLHLYKCHHCRFVHNLKHKVEKHISDAHLDAAIKVITLRSMESEPQEFGPEEETISTPQPVASTRFKAWNCCMCKAKYYTEDDVKNHISKKHNLDAQYKCTLCAFKNDQEANCRIHFKENHPSHEFDVILVYQKIEEDPVKDDGTIFDTTPLWQRDKPRVRHIRGILFDESSPPLSKSPKKAKSNTHSPAKNHNPTTLKATITSTKNPSVDVSPKLLPSSEIVEQLSFDDVSSSISKNVFDCIDAVARGVTETCQDLPGSSGYSSVTEPDNDTKDTLIIDPKSSEEGNVPDDSDDVVLVPQVSNVIVIDSEESDIEPQTNTIDSDTPEVKDKDNKMNPIAQNRSQKRKSSSTDLLHEAVKLAKIGESEDENYLMSQACSKQNLMDLYGDFGSPHNKQWKCPKCNQFKSKRVADFMFHLYKEYNTYRFKCKLCQDLSITYKYMKDHLKVHPGKGEEIIETLPQNITLETWVHLVLRKQSTDILENAPLFQKRPLTGPTNITCYFCSEKFMSMAECCEHMLYHWVIPPYQCKQCPQGFFTVFDIKHHCSVEHPGARVNTIPQGATLSRALYHIEGLKIKPQTSSPDPVAKKPRLITSPKKEVITSGFVINPLPKVKRNANADVREVMEVDIVNVDDDDELVVVSKTDDQVSTEDIVYACDACVHISDTESMIITHLIEVHGVRSKKFHTLSKSNSELPGASKLACNICDEVFSELKLRQHFLANHLESQVYAPYRFKCNICSVRYLTTASIKRHVLRIHDDRSANFECVVPGYSNYFRKPKYKQLFCPLCPYTTVSSSTISIRTHVKGHLKPLLCKYCNMTFKFQREVVVHTAKNHPGLEMEIVMLDNVMNDLTNYMKLIAKNAVLISDEAARQTLESRVAALGNPLKQVAKKSTSAPFVSSVTITSCADAMGDSNLDNVLTTFELGGLEYTTSVNQMMKMFNMNTYVDVSDCKVYASTIGEALPADELT